MHIDFYKLREPPLKMNTLKKNPSKFKQMIYLHSNNIIIFSWPGNFGVGTLFWTPTTYSLEDRKVGYMDSNMHKGEKRNMKQKLKPPTYHFTYCPRTTTRWWNSIQIQVKQWKWRSSFIISLWKLSNYCFKQSKSRGNKPSDVKISYFHLRRKSLCKKISLKMCHYFSF